MKIESSHRWDYPVNEKAFKRKLIMKLVCNEFGVTKEQMIIGPPTRKLGDARKVFAYMLRKHLKDTLHKIAEEICHDHSSVVWALKKLDDFISINDSIVVKLETVERNFLNHKQ